MKVTFDIPDGTLCAILSIVFPGKDSLMIGSKTVASDELFDGSELVYDPKMVE